MRALVALSVALALGLAACGGGDDGGGGGERLSQAEFVEQANGICSDYNDQIEDISEEYTGRITGFEDERSLDAIAEFAGESRQAVENGVEKLRELQPPEDLEERYDDWLAAGDEMLDRIDDLEEAADAGNGDEVQEVIEEAETEERESDRLARELGLDECAED